MLSYSWKSVCSRLLAVFVVMGVGFVAIGCDGKPQQGTKCYSDRDCPANFRCEFSATTSGNADVAAPSQERAAPICDTTSSAEDLPAYCKGVTPPSGQSGQCVEVPQPKGCYSDRDCASNQYCKSNVATPPSTKCAASPDGTTKCFRAPPKGVCTDKPTTKSCTSDGDCASDEYCKRDQTTPTTRCGSGTTSSGDPDDSAGFRAPVNCDVAPPATGTCTKRPTTKSCTSSRDCASDEYCQIATTPSCGGTTDPAPGTGEKRAAMPPEPCDAPPSTGVCVKRPVPPSPPVQTCENDRGCGAGEYCDFSATTHSTDPDEPGTDDAPADPPTGGIRAMPEPPQPPAKRGICRAKAKVQFCRYDGDCKRGYRCGKGNPRLRLLCQRRGAKSLACLNWKPSARGICQPAPPKSCFSDSECGKGQRCVRSASSGDRAMPAPCEPGQNCEMPEPPPPTKGVCQDIGDDEPTTNCKESKRSDGTTCRTCDGVTTCTKATP